MMVQARTTQQVSELRRRIQACLDDRSRDLGFHLTVSAEVQEGDWLYFVVVPDTQDVRAYDYVEVLADVETALRREEGEENMLLVPTMPA